MSESPLSSNQPSVPAATAVSSVAISAFLRGIERRAIVLAELQAGDRHTAETALAASMRAFLMQASNTPMADWPARFWTLLAAAPRLRQPTSMAAAWPAGLDALGGMSATPRLALLLRLVAGLEEDKAAAAMGLALSGYRQALTDACPRDAAGEPDPVAWRALAEAAQQQVRDIAPARLAHLGELREAAIAGAITTPAIAPVSAGSKPKLRARSVSQRRAWRWVVAGIVLCALVLAVIWRWAPSLRADGTASDENALRVVEHGPVQVDALLEGGAPQGADMEALSPDAAMLADAAGMALARDADLYAWYAAGAPVPASDAPAAAEQSDAAEIPETGESNDATF